MVKPVHSSAMTPGGTATLGPSTHLEEEHGAFGDYLRQHDKVYTDPVAYERRFRAWQQSRQFIDSYRSSNPDSSFSVGLNHMSDMTKEEREAMFASRPATRRHLEPPGPPSVLRSSDAQARSLRGFDRQRSEVERNATHSAADVAPMSYSSTHVDWRYPASNPLNVRAVTPVKSQGTCGACWGFSTVAAVEGAVAINTKILNELSVQELIDCVNQNEGCSGGDFDYSFHYAAAQGLASSSDYRFQEEPSGTCSTSKYSVVSRITGYYGIPQCSTSAMLDIVNSRPVAAAIDGSCSAFIYYSGGIFTASCGSSLNHAITIVGYGTEGSQSYWLIKNSWSTTWGEGGYGRIARGVGSCGVSNVEEYAFYAVGGSAYVNGTAFVNDDALARDPTLSFIQKVLAWPYLTLILGILLGLLTLPIITLAVRILRRRGRRRARAAPRLSQQAMIHALNSDPRNVNVVRMVEIRGQPPARQWACRECTFLNLPMVEECEVCGTPYDQRTAVIELDGQGATRIVGRL